MLRLIFFPSPSLSEPFDDHIGEQGNGGSDDDRANEHGGEHPNPVAKRATVVADPTSGNAAPVRSNFPNRYSASQIKGKSGI
jgi:hypothetical protein